MFGWYGSPRVNLVSPPGTARSATQPRVARAVAKIATPVFAHRRSRSRSPQRTALPGLRSGAPGRLDRQLARLPAVLSESDRVAALEALDRDILAESTHRSNEARLRTISSALSLWGMPMWPPTAASWKALAATLKAGRYASAALYFSAYRVAAERRGYVLDDLCIRSIKDYTRSCLRGIGEPCRPRALPFHQLGRLPAGRAAWVSGGPINPKAAIVTGSWWLCREIELSTLRAALVEFNLVVRPPTASLHLPASKTDQLAAGTARTLTCTCSSRPADRASCPVHVLVDHVLYLRVAFPSACPGDEFELSFPLFPSASGRVVQKGPMADSIREAGRFLGVASSAPDGSERLTGHSLRVTGAQGLVLRGWHLWAVQLHGRWGSDVVRRYVRDSPLIAAASSSPSSSGPAGLELEAVVRAVAQLAPAERSGPRSIEAVADRCDAASLVDSGLPPVEHTAGLLELERSAGAEPKPHIGAFVLNTRSGTYHRRAGPSVSRAACGWAFGSWPHAFVSDAGAGPNSWLQLCSRCWPTLRAEAKASGSLVVLCESA